MSKRLQVIFDDKEYAELKRHAKLAKTSLGAWVRDSLRQITAQASLRAPKDKLKALERAGRVNAPICEPSQLKREILQGQLKSNQPIDG